MAASKLYCMLEGPQLVWILCHRACCMMLSGHCVLTAAGPTLLPGVPCAAPRPAPVTKEFRPSALRKLQMLGMLIRVADLVCAAREIASVMAKASGQCEGLVACAIVI